MKKDNGAKRLYNFMSCGWLSRGQAYELSREWGCLGELLKLDIS